MATEDTRQRILDAAGEVFADKGYQAATVREICHKAGANLASVNYYFGDKEHLYVEVFKAAHPGGPELSAVQDWPEKATPEEKIRLFVRRLLERLLSVQTPAWKMRLLQREILDPTAFCMEMMREYFRTRFVQLMGVLDEVLPPEVPEYRRHQMGFSIIGQCVYFRAASKVISMIVGSEEPQKYHTVELLTEHICSVILPALGLAWPIGWSVENCDQIVSLAGNDGSTVFARRSEQDRK